MPPITHTRDGGSVVGLNLGSGPVPQSSAQWEQRIGAGVTALITDDDATALWEQIRISAVPAGADLQDVRVDLSGLQISEEHRSVNLSGIDLTDVPPVSSAQPVRVHRLEVLARPIEWEGVPVTAQLVVEQVPVFVARDGEGNLWALMDPDEAAAQVRGEGTVSVPVEQALRRGRQIVAQALAESGLTLTSLEVDVHTPSPRALELQANARIRKGLLSASAQIRIEAQVDAQMVARIGQVQARSGNPLVALVLMTLRSRLERYTGTTIDLNAHMPPGLRLVGLSLAAEEHLSAYARFA